MMTLLAAVGVAKGWLGGYFFSAKKTTTHQSTAKKKTMLTFGFY